MLDKLLQKVDELKASDLYISVNLPPTVKLNGKLEAISQQKLTNPQVSSLLASVMGEERYKEFLKTNEANFAVSRALSGRFRVSAYMKKEDPAMLVCRIESKIPEFSDLNLPDQLKETCLNKRGLVLFVGATGAGKSSTQAAMIGYRNQHETGHVLMIDD